MTPDLRVLETSAADDDRATAIVYCEANFASGDGKTANGLIRHSERYEILSVIETRGRGLDEYAAEFEAILGAFETAPVGM